jgi:ABC-type transport system involved in multi-copper enzyme maturation permease subunit
MKRVLLKKELRSLRPFLFVVLALVLSSLINAFLMPFEAHSFPGRFNALSNELSVLQIVLGFALGSTLLVREIDDGTLNFLDGLPLERSAIFMAKIKAAMLVLTILPLATLLLTVALHVATRESLDHALQPFLLLIFFALSLLVTAVGLTAGMLLGFLRYLAWLVFVLCAIGLKLLEDPAPSLASALNTADLLTLRFTGTAWQLPLPTIWTQLGAALLFGVSAFVLFSSAGRVLARVQRLQKRRLFVAPVVTVMLIASVGGMVMLTQRNEHKSGGPRSEQADAVEFIPIATGHATTIHYTFSYPALSSARVSPLIALADRTFTGVAALLKIDGGAPIDVDLSGTTENHAGTAYLDRIRMNMGGASTAATLAHETAHVFARRLAGGEHGGQLDGMIVFDEGLAEWTGGKFTSRGSVSQRHELAAAIVSARRLVTPRQLTDHDSFASAVDDNLKYPLGAIFVDRFVGRYGPAAPKMLLSALASKDFPRDLKGYALWQTAFQLAGFDLDLVLDDYARHLKQLEPRFARQIAELPRPRGSLVEQGKGYAVKLRFDLALPAHAYPLVRFRPGNSSNSAQYRTSYSIFSAAAKFTADVPGKLVTRGEVCFQPGIMYEAITIYEPWVCLPVSSASPG